MLSEEVISEIEKEILNNDLDKKYGKEVLILQSPNRKNLHIDINNFKHDDTQNILWISQNGLGLYNFYYYKSNNKVYEVCLWTNHEQKKFEIQYIKDLEKKYKRPDSPFRKSKKRLFGKDITNF